MTRWSLRNALIPVSHQEFVDYTNQFKQAAELSFGTACRLEIKALSAPKVYSTFWDNDLQSRFDAVNDGNTLLKTGTLDDITPALWDDAQYVEVFVTPVDATKAPAAAYAHAEFKGQHPRQATFYIQPDGEDAKEKMLSQQSCKITGDGFKSNGFRNASLPESLGKTVLPHLKKFIP